MAQQDRGGANPAGAAVDQDAFARLQLTQLEDIRPDGEERFRNGGRFAKAEARRDRQRLACRHGAVFGIAAAVGERTNAIAGRKRCDLRADLNHNARHLQARYGGDALGHRVQPLALQDIRPVDAGGLHRNEHLILPNSRDFSFADLQYLRAARLANSDIFHGSSLSPVREMSNIIGKREDAFRGEVVKPCPAV
ncbi:Uncharacterised protein [Klebsiella aerogenes]|nr:Uncharacterised protein [Klebsiella aerogenes]